MEKFCSVCGKAKEQITSHCLYCGGTTFSENKRNFAKEEIDNSKKTEKPKLSKTGYYTCGTIHCVLGTLMLCFEVWILAGIMFFFAYVMFTYDKFDTDKDNKETYSNEFLYAEEIFSLCSEEKIIGNSSKISKFLFMNMQYQNTVEYNEITLGILNEIKRRENVKAYRYNKDIKNITIENIKYNVEKWKKVRINPEIIIKRLNAIISEKNKTENNLIYEKLSEKFQNSLNHFNANYNLIINDFEKKLSENSSKARDRYSNINAPGLNYGIITNSVGSAMAYDVLNASETRKQTREQAYRISDMKGASDSYIVKYVHEKVMKEYDKFLNEIIRETEKFLESDTNNTELESEDCDLENLAKSVYQYCKENDIVYIEIDDLSERMGITNIEKINKALEILEECELAEYDSSDNDLTDEMWYSFYFDSDEIDVKENITEKNENKEENSTDSYEEIKKLKELLDLKIITQEEFDKKKKELLNL